jgi:Ca-activated chloride channel family protein
MTERDTLEMIQFSYEPRAWKHSPMRMDEGGRRQALAWIRRLSASGGTEMREGILAALKGLNVESQRQVVLVTDGLIGFEEEIVAAIVNRLPSGSRVHTVGVGSGVNRTLTAGAARAGRGVEVILGLGEDPEPAAMRLNERTRAPVVVDLELSGSGLLRHFPSRLPGLGLRRWKSCRVRKGLGPSRSCMGGRRSTTWRCESPRGNLAGGRRRSSAQGSCFRWPRD